MRSSFVVGREPSSGDLAHLIEIFEHVCVEHFAAIGTIEAFDVGVLVGLAGLDVAQLHGVRLAPVDEGLGDQFRTVVAADRFGHTTPRSELLEHTHDAFGRNRGVDLDGQRLAHAFVEHVERAEPTSAVEHVS